MPMPQFFQLLTKGVIFFSALGNYFRDDPCECTFFPESRYASDSDSDLLKRAEAIQNTIAGGVGLTNSANIVEINLAAFRRLGRGPRIKTLMNWERKAFGTSVVCSCWYLGPQESAAMWRIYGGETGIAIESTPKRLDEAMKTFEKPLLRVFELCPEVAPVRYNREVDDYYSTRPWLFKSGAFSHEKEIRVFAEVTTLLKPGVEIRFDVKKLVKRVLLTPIAEDWEIDSLKACVEKLISASGFQFEDGVCVSSIRNSDFPSDPTIKIVSRQRALKSISHILFRR